MDEARRPSGPATAVAGAVAGAGLAVLVGLVVFASSAGSVNPVSESTRNRSLPPVPPPSPGGDTPTPTPSGTPTPIVSSRPWDVPDWVVALVQAVLLTAAAIVVLLILRWVVRRVRAIASEVKVPKGLDRDATGAERMVSPRRLAEAVESGLGSVAAGTPSNAIVACWLGLEHAAAGAGVPRRESETPAEFTLRVLGAAEVSRPLLERLAELYREARFSAHDLPESARAEARDALTVLRDQLLTRRGPA